MAKELEPGRGPQLSQQELDLIERFQKRESARHRNSLGYHYNDKHDRICGGSCDMVRPNARSMAQFMNKVAVDLSIARDPRESPVYSIPEAAHYLRIPSTTLRSWAVGRYYPAGGSKKFFRLIIDLADKDNSLLSFMNLVEAHVLDAIRREHHISLAKVRTAACVDFPTTLTMLRELAEAAASRRTGAMTN